MRDCPFCAIAEGRAAAAIAHAGPRLVVFADHAPIRPGHVQIVPRAHVEVFDDLAPDLAAEIVALGQRIARVQKRLYGVARVGFAFTGNDVAHVHAHVVPLHDRTDITSARFFEGPFRVAGPRRAGAGDMAETARRLADGLGAGIGRDGPPRMV